jgi:hypothetical protein
MVVIDREARSREQLSRAGASPTRIPLSTQVKPVAPPFDCAAIGAFWSALLIGRVSTTTRPPWSSSYTNIAAGPFWVATRRPPIRRKQEVSTL